MGENDPVTRRDVLRGRLLGNFVRVFSKGLGQAVGGAGELQKLIKGDAEETSAQPPPPPPPPPLPSLPVLHRPPGAIEEHAFVAECTMCDACAEVCPAGAIVGALGVFGKAARTPVIDARVAACVMCEDMPCITACQTKGTGVLSPDLPVKMGVARVLKPSCKAHAGEACDVCVTECPVEGAMVLSQGIPVIDADLCTGCGVCQMVCPVTPNAIALIATSERPARPVLPATDDLPE